MADDLNTQGIVKMHRKTGRMIREDNSYINLADYQFNSHESYYKKTLDYHTQVSRGEVPNHTVVHKFGMNPNVSATFVPICSSGFYRTPTNNTALEIVSSSTDDTSAGTGARQITYEGVAISGSDLVVVTNTVTLNGTSAVNLPDSLFRLYRWHVSQSGTYASQTSGSHAGTLTIREQGGGSIWSTITTTGFARSQSQIGAYTVPTGCTAYVNRISFSVELDKSADILMFKRNNVLNTTAPFDAMRLVTEMNSASGASSFDLQTPIKIEQETDFGFLGRFKSNTGTMTIDFDFILVEN